MKKKILSIAMSILTTFAFAVGCNKKGGSNNNDGGAGDTSAPITVQLPDSVAPTAVNVIENGDSPYSIVISPDCDDNIKAIASEIQYFYAESTGVVLPIISDEDLAFDEDAYYISLGDTTLFKGSGLTIPSNLRETGYVMKRIGNTVLCNARNSNGTISAGYDMLNYTIGLEFYASDEIYFEEKSTVALLDYDIEFRPTVDIREFRSRAISADATYARRMRMFSWFGTGIWVSFGHTAISQYLPTTVYGHNSEWYNASQTQVCYENEEMRLEMVERIKEYIVSHPYGVYVMLGHEDNLDMCECSDCVEARALMGGYGGQECNFTNKIARDVDAWLADNYPEREIKYLFFAYQTSSEPPATWDETQQKYVPVWEGFDVHESVNVMYCPIEAEFSKPFASKENSAQYEQLRGWSDLFASKGRKDNIVIWTYSIPAYSYMAPQNNFGVYAEHYKTMSDMGVNYIMDQGVYDSSTPTFEALKIYTQCKTMYRSDLDFSELVSDFITHYYGAAAETMMEYYNFFRSYYKYLENSKGFSGGLFFETTLKMFWPYEVLQEMYQMVEKSIAQLDSVKTSDPERYQVLYDRVRREQITPIYLMFEHYMNLLTQEQKEEYWSILSYYCAKFEITNRRESDEGGLTQKIESWKTEIFQ
ncbi:MAG: DUF4838 domain-containing protein [Clostridia bacterium]|nr:DUF4838 domain-containing protein [Clostridia bacterium]